MRMEGGDLPGATEAHSEALSLAKALGDPDQEAPVWNNLGLALLTSAQYSDALRCFERAALLAKASTEPQYVYVESQALSNIATCVSPQFCSAGSAVC